MNLLVSYICFDIYGGIGRASDGCTDSVPSKILSFCRAILGKLNFENTREINPQFPSGPCDSTYTKQMWCSADIPVFSAFSSMVHLHSKKNCFSVDAFVRCCHIAGSIVITVAVH